MEYGILIAESDDGNFQIIGSVDNLDEAHFLALNYVVHGPDSDCLAPDHFEIHRRDINGWYSIREWLGEL